MGGVMRADVGDGGGEAGTRCAMPTDHFCFLSCLAELLGCCLTKISARKELYDLTL